MRGKVRSLYGFSPDLEPFAGKAPGEQVRILMSWGNTAVFGGYQDPAFVHAAHEAGMPVYAEFGCFVGQRWWKEVPDSRPVTAEGKLLQPEGSYYGVNPSVSQVRQRQLEALSTLLEKHAIDGVWLDFVRWPCHWEVHDPYLPHTSFDAPTLARFSQDPSIVLPEGEASNLAQMILSRYQAEWTAWRCEQITSWVRDARAIVDDVRSGALLGLFGVPWRHAEHDAAILTVIGQDYQALGPCVDVFSPMVYHLMCGRDTEWIARVTEEVHALSGKPVWPIVQSVDVPRTLSAIEYGRALEAAYRCPASEGVLVYHMRGALEGQKLAVTREKFGSHSLSN